MIVLKFAQPNVPLSINKANTMHWAARSRALKVWGLCVREAWQHLDVIVEPKPVTVQVTLEFTSNRRRDAHNYTGTVVKTIIDSLVRDCKLIPDDTPQWLTVLDSKISIVDSSTPACTITINYIQGGIC